MTRRNSPRRAIALTAANAPASAATAARAKANRNTRNRRRMPEEECEDESSYARKFTRPMGAPRSTRGWREATILNLSAGKAFKKFQHRAMEVAETELQQLLDMHVWRPVHASDLSPNERRRILRSSMNFKEKTKPDGTFDKLKARDCADGRTQDRSLYTEDQVTSPTVATPAVFMAITIAAAEGLHIATVDVKGAYLHVSLPDSVVLHMRIDPRLSAIICKLDPSYSQYLDEKGCLVVRLLRALYGLIEAARLWYDHISNTLIECGYTKNAYDPCVFHKGKDIVTVHVDDLLIACESKSELERVLAVLQEKYKTLNIVRGNKHDYLGMTFEIQPDRSVTVSMTGFVNELVKKFPATMNPRTPAALTLFETDADSPDLSPADAFTFHSATASLLYLAKRACPSILTAVAFLATRVQGATKQDMKKLRRTLSWVAHHQDKCVIRLGGKHGVELNAFVDASYGVHVDGRSHTGGVVTLNGGPVITKSTKQRINCKSSTEAEIIAISDMLSPILWARNFLAAAGRPPANVTLKEDNMSVMAMIDRGRSTNERTRHINIRYFFIHDLVKRGIINVEHCPTADQLADAMTKALAEDPFLRHYKTLHNVA